MPEIHLTPELIFTYATYGVLPFWALLIVIPHLKLTDLIVHSVAAPLLFPTAGARTMHSIQSCDFAARTSSAASVCSSGVMRTSAYAAVPRITGELSRSNGNNCGIADFASGPISAKLFIAASRSD